MPDEPGGVEEGPLRPAAEDHLNLVRHVARRFAAAGHEFEDLFQIGCLGLCKAAERFDPQRGVAFSSFAVPYILGEIRQFLRDDGPLKVGREVRRLGLRAREAAAELAQALGRDPFVAEVAEHLGIDTADVAAALDAQVTPLSLDAPMSEPTLDVAAPTPWQDQVHLRLALERLPDTQRQVLWHRFFLDRTQAQTGEALRVSQVQVSRLERRALLALRSLLS